jgi:hypothetical protein
MLEYFRFDATQPLGVTYPTLHLKLSRAACEYYGRLPRPCSIPLVLHFVNQRSALLATGFIATEVLIQLVPADIRMEAAVLDYVKSSPPG